MNNTSALLFASLLALIVGLAIGFLLGKRVQKPLPVAPDLEKARLDENLKACLLYTSDAADE